MIIEEMRLMCTCFFFGIFSDWEMGQKDQKGKSEYVYLFSHSPS